MLLREGGGATDLGWLLGSRAPPKSHGPVAAEGSAARAPRGPPAERAAHADLGAEGRAPEPRLEEPGLRLRAVRRRRVPVRRPQRQRQQRQAGGGHAAPRQAPRLRLGWDSGTSSAPRQRASRSPITRRPKKITLVSRIPRLRNTLQAGSPVDRDRAGWNPDAGGQRPEGHRLPGDDHVPDGDPGRARRGLLAVAQAYLYLH